jgi:cyanophycinase
MAEAAPSKPRKPIYLLADSQLLFWKPDGKAPFLNSVLRYVAPPGRAAYVGASNGDQPEFYALFVVAMTEIGITDCCHVHAQLPAEEAEFLATADLILLAGGDTELGLHALRSNGAAQIVTRRYHEGCVLLAVSAGAVQLGHGVIVERAAASELLPGLGLVPWMLDAHQEASGWSRLSRTVRILEGTMAGLGIPSGGGVLFHPDGTLEPVRTWAHELTHMGGKLRHRMLLPAVAREARSSAQ